MSTSCRPVWFDKQIESEVDDVVADLKKKQEGIFSFDPRMMMSYWSWRTVHVHQSTAIFFPFYTHTLHFNPLGLLSTVLQTASHDNNQFESPMFQAVDH